LLNGHTGARELHVAVLGNRAGLRSGDADFDLSGGLTCGHQGGGGAYGGDDCSDGISHWLFPVRCQGFFYS
jgi:hypothetical protein